MKITKVKVGRGVSEEVKENLWDKTYIEYEAVLDHADEAEEATNRLEAMIEQRLFFAEKPKPKPTPAKTAKPKPAKIEGADKINWQASRWVRKNDRDRKARHGEDAYCHRSAYGAGTLIDLITREGQVFDADYVYTFSGESDTFISRKALKKKE